MIKDCMKGLGLGTAIALSLSGCQQQTAFQPNLPLSTAQVMPVWSTMPISAAAISAQMEAASAIQTEEVIAVDPNDLWAQLRRSMRLDHHLDQRRVQQELRWLKRHPNYLKRLAPRLQRYLPYIFEQTQLRSVPGEIALLPIVESALDTFAFSHGGAAGPWQFVSGTARQYGLTINDWYDGRRDVVASTEAALDFLTDLHDRFDDWYLALAGYNAGQGNVNRALRRNPNAGFFDLRLPRETQAYVPRLLSLAELIADPETYGIELPEIERAAAFDTLTTHSQFELRKLSHLLSIGEEELYEWNPALNQWSTPPAGPHRIIVPNHLDLVMAQQRIDEVPANARVDWQEVVVKPGDTLSHIARRYHTDIAALRNANGIRGSQIRAGRKLLIPKNGTAMSSLPRPIRQAQANARYVVKPGDSLWRIAKQHNLSVAALMRANHLGPKDTLSVGRTLHLPGVTSSARDAVIRKVRYRVRKGDSLSRIAAKFKVSVQQITQWNDLNADRYLQPGQGLLLFVNVVGG